MLTRRALLAASAVSSAALARPPAARAATPADIVVMAMQIDDMISLDPAESYEGSDNQFDGNMYRKLVAPDPTTGQSVTGDVAKSWDVTPDGRTFTFHLGDDAFFESGQPVTAHDVAFTFQRIVLLNKTPAFIVTQFGFTPDNVQRLIRATDDKTLVLELPSPFATSFVLLCLSANVGGIVEKATALAHQANGDLGNGWLRANSAGAGPFRLTAWAASDHVILDANPKSGLKIGPKRVLIRHVKEPATQLLLLRKGDIDVAWNLGADQLKTLAGNPDFTLQSSPQGTSMYIALNQANTDLRKVQVAQAIKWSIDYEAIATNITPRTWQVSQSFLPMGIPGALDETPFHKDVAKAKQLLASAGVPDGFSVTMDFIANSPFTEIAQAVQADLAAVGIKVQLLPGEQKQVYTKMRARQHQMALTPWFTDYIDPNSNTQAWCANPDDSDKSKLKVLAWRSHFVDQQLTAQADEATKILDPAKRMALYGQMQREFWERGPFVFLLQQNEIVAMPKGVSGLLLGPTPDYFRYGSIRKA